MIPTYESCMFWLDEKKLTIWTNQDIMVYVVYFFVE